MRITKRGRKGGERRICSYVHSPAAWWKTERYRGIADKLNKCLHFFLFFLFFLFPLSSTSARHLSLPPSTPARWAAAAAVAAAAAAGRFPAVEKWGFHEELPHSQSAGHTIVGVASGGGVHRRAVRVVPVNGLVGEKLEEVCLRQQTKKMYLPYILQCSSASRCSSPTSWKPSRSSSAWLQTGHLA